MTALSKKQRNALYLLGAATALGTASFLTVEKLNNDYLETNGAYRFNPKKEDLPNTKASFYEVLQKTHFSENEAGIFAARSALQEMQTVREFEIKFGGIDDRYSILESWFPDHVKSYGPLQISSGIAKETFKNHEVDLIQSGLFQPIDFNHQPTTKKQKLKLNNWDGYFLGTLHFLDLERNWRNNAKKCLDKPSTRLAAISVEDLQRSISTFASSQDVFLDWSKRVKESKIESIFSSESLEYTHAAYTIGSKSCNIATIQSILNQWRTLENINARLKEGSFSVGLRIPCSGKVNLDTKNEFHKRTGIKYVNKDHIQNLEQLRKVWFSDKFAEYCKSTKELILSSNSKEEMQHVAQCFFPTESGISWVSGAHLKAILRAFIIEINDSSMSNESKEALFSKVKNMLKNFLSDRNEEIFEVITSAEKFESAINDSSVDYSKFIPRCIGILLEEQGFECITAAIPSRLEDQGLFQIRKGVVNPLYRGMYAGVSDSSL